MGTVAPRVVVHAMMFVHTNADIKRQKKQLRIFLPLMLLLTVLVAVVKVSNILDHFQQHNWFGLAGDAWPFLALLLVLPSLNVFLKNIKGSLSLPEKVLVLREKLADETLIPPVADQPLPLAAEELPFAPVRIGPVRHVYAFMSIIGVFGLFLLLIDAALVAMAVQLTPYISIPVDLFAIITLGVLFLSTTIFVIILLVMSWRLISGRKVAVNDWGLRWKWPKLIGTTSVAFAWHEITGFYLIKGENEKGGLDSAYILDSPNSTFVWWLLARSTPEEQQASTYLSRLTITRTGQSLRDLTYAIEPLLYESSSD